MLSKWAFMTVYNRNLIFLAVDLLYAESLVMFIVESWIVTGPSSSLLTILDNIYFFACLKGSLFSLDDEVCKSSALSV